MRRLGRLLAPALLGGLAAAQVSSGPFHRLEGFALDGGGGALVSGSHAAWIGVGPGSEPMASASFTARVGLLTTTDPLGPGPPVLLAVDPPTGHWSGGTDVRVLGLHLGDPAPIVRVGGAPAPWALAHSGTVIEATTPPGAPGPADVELQGASGDDRLADGFTFTPAVLVASKTAIGDTLVVENVGASAASFTTLMALGTAELVLQPFGTLLLDPATISTLIPLTDYGPGGRATTPFQLPEDPALAGLALHFQSAVVTSPFPLAIAFTNRASALLVAP